MNKTLLQEVKAMNEIAGTQMTKQQEIKFIKDRLQELEFGTQAAFDTYNKNHKMRPDTKVKIAGKDTTAGAASKKSAPAKGSQVFGNEKSITDIKTDKQVDVSTISKSLSANLRVKDGLGVTDKDADELQKRLNKGDEAVYKRTSPHGGLVTFKDGSNFDVYKKHDAKKTGDTTIYAIKNK